VKMHRRTGLIAVAVSAGLMLMALGQGAVAPNAAASGSANGVVTQPLVIVPSPGETFEPNFSPFQGSPNPGTLGLIYQPLFYFDNVSTNVYPFLGTTYHWADHNRTLIVNLQRHAEWTDHVPFTSKDVVFTFDLLKKYPAADTNGDWTQLQSVKANGKYQVIFQFKTTDVPFADYVLGTYIVPEHIWSKLGNPVKVVMSHPVGTGPYTLSSFSTEVYRMTANPDYYQGEPKIRNLEFPSYTGNNSADLALNKGEIGWAGIFEEDISRLYAAKSPNNKYWFPPTGITTLYPNLKNPLLKNLAVRKAISEGINREVIFKDGEYGYEPVASPTGLILPNDMSWMNDKLPMADRQFVYSPSLAVKTLEAAGFHKGPDGIFETKQGQPLSFTLQVVTGWTDWDEDCLLIQQELKQVGIQIKVQELQFGSYFSNMQSHKFDLAVSWVNTGPNPYYMFQNMLAPKGGWNLEQWSSPVTTRALADFALTANAAKQHAAIDAIESVMATQLPTIPLVFGANWYEYNTTNIVGWPTPQDAYVNPSPYTYPAIAVVLMHLHGRS
jgi:peptide/nickel transport system substrate-binding protein